MVVQTFISFWILLLPICWGTTICPPAFFFNPTQLLELIDELDIPDFEELSDRVDHDDTAEQTAQRLIQTNVDAFRKHVLIYETGEEQRGGSPMSIIKKDGYNPEKHIVTTNDGYILTLHRILPRGYDPSGPEKETNPVFLGHGLLGSSADWLMVDKDRALPYLLSNAGYDVWMGNARGNEHSRKHVIDTDEYQHFRHQRYWNFSVHEMGERDLPVMIDKIIEVTGAKKINYIGYSMSATFFHIMLSKFPEYNSKIRKAVSLAPAVYASNMTSPTKCLLAIQKTIRAAVYVGLSKFVYYGVEAINKASPSGICGTQGSHKMCQELINYVAGPSSESNRTVLGYAQYYFPSATSARTVDHFIQFFRYPRFRPYNFGTRSNFRHYGKKFPPKYNLGNTTVDMKFFYGRTDHLTVVKDVEFTIRRLRRLGRGTIKKQIVEDSNKKFNHLDFYYHDDACNLVYKPLIQYLNEN